MARLIGRLANHERNPQPERHPQNDHQPVPEVVVLPVQRLAIASAIPVVDGSHQIAAPRFDPDPILCDRGAIRTADLEAMVEDNTQSLHRTARQIDVLLR